MSALYITHQSNQLRMLSDLKYLINIELLNDHYKDNYHPLALQIVKGGTIYYAYTLFLLMKTLLRYSDVIKFDIKEAIRAESFLISQKKTGQPIRNSFKIFDRHLKDFLLYNEEKLIINSYDGLRQWLKKYLAQNYSGIKLEFSNKTHLFRHLGASFLYQQNKDVDKIKSLLGHTNLDSTRYYIHQL